MKNGTNAIIHYHLDGNCIELFLVKVHNGRYKEMLSHESLTPEQFDRVQNFEPVDPSDIMAVLEANSDIGVNRELPDSKYYLGSPGWNVPDADAIEAAPEPEPGSTAPIGDPGTVSDPA